MTTLWKWRLFLFVRAVDATNANKNALAAIYVNNGSGETLTNEKKMFNSVTRFSMTGAEPATFYGLNLAAQTAMKDQFVALISGLTNPAWAVLANTTLPQYADGEVVAISANLPQGAIGQVVTWEQAKGYLLSQFGLREIPPPDIEAGAVAFGATPTVAIPTVAVLGRQVIAGRIIPAYTTTIGERIWDASPETWRSRITGA